VGHAEIVQEDGTDSESYLMEGFGNSFAEPSAITE
jgi:hypothetical protein